MAKETAKKSKPVKKPNPEWDRFVRRFTLNAGVIGFLLVLGTVGFLYLRRYVERKSFPTDPPDIVLVNRPVWMSDFLAEQIANTARPRTAHSPFDQQMLIDSVAMLRTNPWIKDVKQIRRAYRKSPGDILEIDCTYRAPIAIVQWGDFFSLVDGEGVKLPEQFTFAQLSKIMFGQDGRMNIRIIDGVSRPPPEPGHKWIGDDLTAGLALVKLLYGQPYAEEIRTVRISNFGGRVDPKEAWLVCVTREQTEIRWGRVKDNDPAEVSIAQKLLYLNQIVEKYHRVDANHSAVDIRFDRVTFPSDEEHRTSPAADSGR